MGCGASSGGVKYQGAEDPVETSAKKAAEGQPAASAVLGQAESAPDGDKELKPEREPEAPLLFERRAGWVAMKVAPPSRKLKPEWVARWLVQVDGSLRVFTSQPGLQPAHAGRSKRGGQPQPVQSLALSGIVVEKIPRSKMPEGRASSLLLRARKEEELEQDARAAAIDDAFTVPTRGSQAAAKAKKKKPAKNTSKPPTRKVAGRGKKASRGKGEGGGGTRASKSKSTKKSDEPGDAGKRSKSSAKARKGRQNAEGPGSTKDPSKETAAVQLTVDLGTGTELLWWCRALFEGGAQVPSDIEAKLWQMYSQEQHERVLAARRVWRQRLVRMSRYIPRCVLQCHTQEDKIAPVDEPRMEIFDAAVAQIRLPGVTRVVERFSTKHDAGMRKLQALHASLFAIVLGCIDQHGGDVVSLGGDAVVAMWGRARGWGRQDADKLKRDVIRACQCMERLRAVVDGAAAQNAALQGTKFSVRVSITAGRICGVWAGGFHERRQFLLKGSPIVRLRHAAALAMDGDIILAPDAHELCEEGSWLVTRAVDAGHATSADDSGAQRDSDVYLAMEKMVPGADGAGATPTIPAAPLSSFTSHPKMTEDIAKLQTKRAELQSDLGRLQLEETPEISEDNLHALTQFDSVMKAIIKLRSILKEEFLDNLLAFLKAQGQADFNLISKYEKARRIMLELLTDETMDEFRSAHWDKWDVWKDAVQESLELDRRQKMLDNSSEVQPEAEPDGDAESNDADTESFIVEPSKRQIFDHGTKEILLHGTLQAIADIDEAMKLQDYEHEQWQRPVMDVILEYIPDNAQEFVEGHAEHKLKQVSVVCVQLPEQNFDQEDEELRRTAMTELQHIVLCMQQLADKFRADLRELVTNRNATILALILEQTSHAHHAKVALAVALGVRDCFTQMNMESAIAVTAGQVYDTLVGDNDGTRCQLACMGAVVDSAIGLLHSATLLPAEFGGIVCDEVVRNGALTSQAALSPNPATAVWTMDLVFDTLGRISVDGRRLRAYAPRRFEEWAGGYLLRCRCAPFYPELSIGVIGRHSEVLQLRDWFARSGNRRALVRGCQGSGKTALAAAFYDDLYHHGYICLAGRALQVRQNTPYHVWNEVVEALLVFACKSTQLPVLHSTDAQALENSLQPTNTHRASSEPPSTSMKMGASKCSEITPWWLNGTECGDATALLDAAVESLPDDLRSIHPVVDMMLPNVEVSETPATKELDGKVRASTTSAFVLDLITLVLRRTGRRLCIMMDDVQWLDHSSAALVRYILKKLPEVTWYFNVDDASITDSRFCTALCRSPDTLALALGELAPEHTLVLAEQQCAQMDAPMLEPATRDFFLTLPGIPLHTIHFTLSLFETDDIIPYKGCARAGPRLIEPDQRTLYPSDIGAIIRTRLENLEEDLRPLVLLPSVLDNTRAFTPTSAVRLAQIYEGFDPTTPHVTTLAQIERLCTMKLLAWSEKWTQQLAFSSKLVRDIAYEKLPPRQRCSLHENMAVHLNTKHLASKENVRDILDSVYEKCEDPFCTSRDVKYIQEHSFDVGKIDTNHRAWTSRIPQDHSKLAGKPIHMPGHGFGIVKNLNGNKLTGFSVQAIFDNGATEKLSLDTNGSDLLSFKYFDIEDMAAAAETAIRRAETRYHKCRDHSAYFQYEADEQLLLLDALDDKAVTLLQGCVENLYCSVKQMARAGALVEAAQSVSKTLTLFDQLPDKDTIPRQTQELELLSIFHRNWLAEDVSELYRGVRPPHIARMRTVANKLGATEHVFPIAVSEWLMEYFARKRDLHMCIRLARHFLTRVETESNEALLLEAYRMLWIVHADKGEWTETIRLCNKVVHLGPDTESLYSPAKFHESTFRYAGIDPGVSAWSMLATAYTKIGNLHQALQSIKRMSELAQELEHPLSLAVALSTQLSLQFEMKVLRSTEMVPIVEDFQAVHGFPRLSLVIQCSMAEQDAAIAREVYSSVIQQTKESLKEETWATNQRNIGPILRACQLAGEYGTGMALAVEIWMESEVAVGRFQSETWCAWMPETYLYLGQFKLMEAEEEQQPDMSIKERALWREEVWAEGLRYLAQSVVASRINGAAFTELRALLILHRALEATKIKGALRPRKWVQELDPTILNAICVAERLQAVYDQLGGESLTDWPDVNAAKILLGRVKAQRKTAAIHQNRKSFFKQATHQALEEQRRKEEAGRLRKQRAQNMWRLGRASAVSETAEAKRLEMEGECHQKCDIAEVRKAEHVRAVAALEDAEAECKISGWTFREKDKFGDFVAAFASLAAGQLTWLKAGDVDKATGHANLNGCTARPVAKPRRKHPSAFEIALDPQVQVDSGEGEGKRGTDGPPSQDKTGLELAVNAAAAQSHRPMYSSALGRRRALAATATTTTMVRAAPLRAPKRSHGRDPNERNSDGRTPLHFAACHGHEEACSALLHARADINAADKNGQTALHFATAFGNEELVRSFILLPSCDTTARDLSLQTALHVAFRCGAANIAKMLRLHPSGDAAARMRDIEGRLPASLAPTAAGRQLLRECNAVVAAIRRIAQMGGQEELNDMLVNDDATFVLGWRDADQRGLLHYAACHGREQLCRLLLNPPAAASDVTPGLRAESAASADRRGFTPLHYAASWGHAGAMAALLDSCTAAGSDAAAAAAARLVSAVDREGLTPLHCASMEGREDAAALLLLRGASASAADNRGRNPVDVACNQTLRDLLGSVRPPSAKPPTGHTLNAVAPGLGKKRMHYRQNIRSNASGSGATRLFQSSQDLSGIEVSSNDSMLLLEDRGGGGNESNEMPRKLSSLSADVMGRLRAAVAHRQRILHAQDDVGDASSTLFSWMDRDGDGSVGVDEFEEALRQMGLHLEEGDAAEVAQALDKNGDGEISFEEFEMELRELDDDRSARRGLRPHKLSEQELSRAAEWLEAAAAVVNQKQSLTMAMSTGDVPTAHVAAARQTDQFGRLVDDTDFGRELPSWVVASDAQDGVSGDDDATAEDAADEEAAAPAAFGRLFGVELGRLVSGCGIAQAGGQAYLDAFAQVQAAVLRGQPLR